MKKRDVGPWCKPIAVQEVVVRCSDCCISARNDGAERNCFGHGYVVVPDVSKTPNSGLRPPKKKFRRSYSWLPF